MAEKVFDAMKKLLFILIILPCLVFSQLVPLKGEELSEENLGPVYNSSEAGAQGARVRVVGIVTPRPEETVGVEVLMENESSPNSVGNLYTEYQYRKAQKRLNILGIGN